MAARLARLAFDLLVFAIGLAGLMTAQEPLGAMLAFGAVGYAAVRGWFLVGPVMLAGLFRPSADEPDEGEPDDEVAYLDD